MSETSSEKRRCSIPLWTLSFLCLSTFLVTHLRVTVSKKIHQESFPNNRERNWTIWKYQQTNDCGLFLKAVILMSSPFLPLTSTLLLVVGLRRGNFYLFIPWLLLTAKGLLVVQSLNLREMYEKLSGNDLKCDQWKYFSVYAALLLIEMAGCFCYREIFSLFKRLWVIDPRECHGNSTKEQQRTEEEEKTVAS